MRNLPFALAAAVFLPVAANAVTLTESYTLTANEGYAFAEVLNQKGAAQKYDRIEYTFTAGEDLMVNVLGVTATGTNDGNDIRELLFGIGMADTAFGEDEISTSGETATAETFVPFNKFLSANDMFTFIFDIEDTKNPVSVGLSFETGATEVPVPAAGLLLGSVLLGGSFLARRKNKA